MYFIVTMCYLTKKNLINWNEKKGKVKDCSEDFPIFHIHRNYLKNENKNTLIDSDTKKKKQ